MIHYRLNMAKGYVLPLEQRRKWLHWLALYLLVMAVAIAFVLHLVITRSLHWHAQYDFVVGQEYKLLMSHPQYKSVEHFKNALGAEVSACLRDLDCILKFGNDEQRIAAILLSLMEPLPVGLGLGAFHYDGGSRKVVFDILMPTALKQDEKTSPPKLVALWEKHPLLSRCFKQLEMENSERTRLGGGEMMCWRFSAIMGGSGHD